MDILENKQFKDYSYFSRYASFPLYYNRIDNKYIYGTTSQLNDNVTYVLYKVKLADTLDSIALFYYNSPTYYWVLADFNKIQDPFVELVEGQELKIPTLNSLTFRGEE